MSEDTRKQNNGIAHAFETADRAAIFARCRRIVVKLGSSILTSPRGLDRVSIHRISDQIAELRERGCEVIIVSSGAVASGLRKLGLTERPRSIPQKQATAAVGQTVLMEAWERAFDKYEILVAQLLLTSEGLQHRHRYLNARNTLETLLEWKIVPVVNENDTVVVDEIKFGDNDRLSVEISGLTGADLVINLTDIDGLFDSDPRVNPAACLIRLVENPDEVEACVSAVPGAVGTGGMRSKLKAARKSLAMGVPMVIAPGRERDVLLRLFDGEEIGTLFIPGKKVHYGKKLWLANLRNAAGDLIVDAGAVNALRNHGKSLLPIGVREVRGTFGLGAAVRCLDPDGELIGIGLTNYDSREIRGIKGRHSHEIEELLGYKHSDEVINRDNFVLADETVAMA